MSKSCKICLSEFTAEQVVSYTLLKSAGIFMFLWHTQPVRTTAWTWCSFEAESVLQLQNESRTLLSAVSHTEVQTELSKW